MIILFAYSVNDEALARKNATWMLSLKNDTPLRVVEIIDSRCTSRKLFGDKTVGTVTVKDRYNSWPESPNQMFEEGARYMEYMMPKEKSFLWLEPDAIPLKDGWLDKIIAERNKGYSKRKPFLGAYVPGAPGQEHLSGIAVYPNPVVLYAGLMLLSSESKIPFDIIDGANVVRQSHVTDLIQNRPRQAEKVGDKWIHKDAHPPFLSLEDFYKVATKECVLFHSDKTGSLIDLLSFSLGKEKIISPVRHGSAETTTTLTSPDLEARSGTEPKPAGELTLKEKRQLQAKRMREAKAEKARIRWETQLEPLPVSSREKNERVQEKNGKVEPWNCHIESVAEINRLCRELKRFCGAPRWTSRVRQELKSEGVIK